jgi:hypothetical protein
MVFIVKLAKIKALYIFVIHSLFSTNLLLLIVSQINEVINEDTLINKCVFILYLLDYRSTENIRHCLVECFVQPIPLVMFFFYRGE